MKSRIAAIALFCSAAMMCSESNADLLGRMLGRGGCGDCQTVSSCCDTPAPACGDCSRGISINIHIGLPGRLFRGGCGGGLLARDAGCGCDTGCAPAVAPVVDAGCGCGVVEDACGCGSGGLLNGNLLGRLRGRFGNRGCGCEMPAADCGCAAPVMDTCGPTCDDGCGCGGGLFDGGLLGRLRGRIGGCGCDVAPAADCGCAPAPVMNFNDCGCDTGCDDPCATGGRLRGRVSGLLSRLKPSCGSCGAPAADCGCAPAPVVTCGCDNAPACGCGRRHILGNLGGRLKGMCNHCGSTACDGGCGGSKLSLMARLRGDRTIRNHCGCNDGCHNSGCMTGCDGCGSTMMPYHGNMTQPAPAIQEGTMETAPEIAPVPEATTEGAVEAAPTDGAYRQPVVDPKAFVIRRN